MNRTIFNKNLLAGLALTFLISACSSTRRSSGRTAPTPTVTDKNIPEKKKPEEKKKDKSAPFNVPAFGKEVKKDVYNIALFASLYLDSAFAGGELPGRTLPRYVLPGLEFYEGAQLALDSLQQLGYKLNVTVYDSKSRNNSVARLISSRALESADLIIGAVTNPDLKELSDFAKEKEINFVSATWPNDGGISDNPFLFITNSTLKTHGEALHQYVQEAFATKNIVVFHRNTAFENRMVADFKNAYDKMDSNKKSRIRDFTWKEGTSDTELSGVLLSDRPNICIVTALDEAGAKSILHKLSSLSATYPLHIFGMPTWDIMRFNKEADLKGLQIYYTSPYFNDKTDYYSRHVYDYFKKTYKSRPSDMAFKGFELTLYFTKLLGEKGVYFNAGVNDPSKVITRFNFQPVYLKEGMSTPSYFENKNIYIIQKGDSMDVKMNK